MNYYLLSLHNQNYIYKNNDIKNISINMRPFDNEFSYLSTFNNDLTVINFTYHPFLLYLFHNKGLYSIPCLNIFDKILDVKQQHIVPFKVEDFKFEDSIEWTYTPYNILGTDFKNKNAVAKVTDDGYIYAIDIYKNEELSTRYYIDCRGFVSSRWSVVNKKLLEGSFFNPKGEEIFILNEDRSAKIINNVAKEKYKASYNNIYDFLLDVFNQSIKFKSKDMLFAELNQANFDAANTIFNSKYISYVNFGTNTSDSEIKKLIERIDSSNTVYVDSPDEINKFHKFTRSDNKLDIKTIDIYDSRIKTNESNFVGYNKILLYVDKDSDEHLEESVNCIFNNIKKINKPRISFIFKSKFGEDLKSKIYKYLDKFAKNLEDDMINFVCVNDDIQLFQELSDTRLFINTSNSIDVYFQQSAFRAGIPQINFLNNGNIDERKNGITVSDKKELSDAINFYLNNLDNWNKTFTYCKKTYGD